MQNRSISVLCDLEGQRYEGYQNRNFLLRFPGSPFVSGHRQCSLPLFLFPNPTANPASVNYSRNSQIPRARKLRKAAGPFFAATGRVNFPGNRALTLWRTPYNTIHDTRYTIHDTRYTVHGTRYTIHDTRYVFDEYHMNVSLKETEGP
jgi:hypothetical protein